MERSASIFKYYGNKFIDDKMKKAKKREEKLKKTRNRINPLSQKILKKIILVYYFQLLIF